MEELKKSYKHLVESLTENKENYKEEDLVIFTPGIGKNYKGDLLIIGRAVNDWHIYLNKNNTNKEKNDIVLQINNEIENHNLDWVYERWGNQDGQYNTKKSAFWRVTNMLAELITKVENPIHSIVYSNLYKVAKSGGGNPSDKLCDIQFKICADILRQEIEFFKPKIIVMLTGLNWADYFLEDLKVNNELKQKTDYVSFVGQYKQSKIVVSPHPQGKSENEIIKEIFKFLKK